jgi:poly(A) polymerase
MEPTILQRPDHTVSRKDISQAALKVLYRLHERGYKAYLAGGCVRDLLLGKHPKDFDVVTDATPQEVRRCFSHCRLIGRRFRLAHVIFGDEVIEVATFRAASTADDTPEDLEDEEDLSDPTDQTDLSEEDSDESEGSEESDERPTPKNNRDRDSVVHEETGVVLRDNVFGTPEEDAFRRDFTINAMFYNIADFSIIDYVGGLKDIEKKVVHAIGDPDLRYQEDPVRMIRALRFASTLGINIEENTYEAILRQREHLAHASHARMYEEILKFFYSGSMNDAFDQWCETGLLDVMFPGYATWVREGSTEEDIAWLRVALQQMDKWKRHKVKASQELLYALYLAPYIRAKAAELTEVSPRDALMTALQEIQAQLSARILIPKRILFRILDILTAQERFDDRRNPDRIHRFVRRPYFRDALVFYKIDALAKGENRADLISAWSRDLADAPPPEPSRQRRPSRGRPRRRRQRR